MAKSKLLLAFFIISALFFPNTIYATSAPTSDKGVPISDVFPVKFPTLGSLVSTLLPNTILFAGIGLFILALIGGLAIMAGAGSGDSGTTEKGRGAIIAAVVGFAIIFVAIFIIQLIEFITGVDILNTPF